MLKKNHVTTILGGGISGLTSALNLAKNGIKVRVIEKNKELGGLARSKINEKNEFTEICIHIIGSTYENFINVLDQLGWKNNIKAMEERLVINYDQKIKDKAYAISVSGDYLAEKKTIRNVLSMDKELRKQGTNLTLSDKWKLLNFYVKTMMLSEEKLLEYDDIKWVDYWKDASPEAYRWIGLSALGYLGGDMNTSAYPIAKLLRMKGNNNFKNKDLFFSLTRPYHELFKEWKEILENHGCEFYQDTVVEYIEKDGLIKSVKGLKSTYDSDSFICALPPYNKLSGAPELDRLSKHMQSQVNFALKKKLKAHNGTFIHHPHSPWWLMSKVKSGFYDVEKNFGVKELISAAITLVDHKGFNGKTFLESTIEEIKEETWRQLSYGNWMRDENNDPITKDDIIYSSIFETFKETNTSNGLRIATEDMRMSNSIGVEKVRPTTKTKFENLFNAGAHTKTKYVIFNMESAAESGLTASKEVLSYAQSKMKF